MKAGRELDALIDEKIFGFHVAEGEHDVTLSGDGVYWMSVDGRRLRVASKNGELPHYSTQIAAAWLVVEKMNNDGYCVEIFHDMVAWSVCFMHINTAEKHCADWKHSVETQICLAALAAVEYERCEHDTR